MKAACSRFFALALFFPFGDASGAGGIEIISRDQGGDFPDSGCFLVDITPDGRFALFSSAATDLVAGDTNGVLDLFLYDSIGGMIERVSLDENGAQIATRVSGGSISDDGNVICFESEDANVVTGDTNGAKDVFVRNRSGGGSTVRVSLNEAGGEISGLSDFASISGNGLYVIFRCGVDGTVTGDTNGENDIFRRDFAMNTTIRVSVGDAEEEANDSSISPSISDDGNLIAFISGATNLVTGDTNGHQDTFVRDVMAGSTTRVSVANNGAQGIGGGTNEQSQISGDGSAVAFGSSATNLVPGDTNGVTDVFVRDLNAGTTELITITRAGVRNDGFASFPTISQNGRYVGFQAREGSLDSRVQSAFLTGFGFDRETRDIACIHFNQDGEEGESGFGITGSSVPLFTNDGHLYFDSGALNLLPVDNPTSGTHVFTDFFNPPPFVDTKNSALCALLKKKLKKLKKRLKAAKRTKKVARIKSFKKKIKKVKRQIRAVC